MVKKESLRYGNAVRPFYRKNDEEKQVNLPSNNKKPTRARKVSQQTILVKDPKDPTKVTKKTIFHVNYSPYEQRRIHTIKEALANGDTTIMTKLSPNERKMYDILLKEKEKNIEQNDN